MNVIIVDDEAIVRHGIRHSVDWNEMGVVRVEEASNGREVLENWDEWAPDLIVTDIKMPVMDGIALIREAKRMDPGCICIVLSCADEFELVKEALLLGAADYLLKMTVRPEELMACIRNMTAKRSAERIRSGRGLGGEGDMAQMCGLRSSLERFAAAVLQVNPSGSSASLGSEYRHHSALKLIRLLEEVEARGSDFVLVRVEDGDPALLFDHWPHESVRDCFSRIKTRLQHIGGIISRRTGLEFRFGVSDIHTSPDRIHPAYREAKAAAEHQFFHPVSGIHYYHDFKKEYTQECDAEIRAIFDNPFRMRLTQALLTGSEEEAVQTISHYFDHLMSVSCSLDTAYDCVDKAAAILRVAAMEMSTLCGGMVYAPLASFDGQAVHLRWNCHQTSLRLIAYCRYLFMTRRGQQEDRGGSRIVHEIQRYLRNHYREKVTLENTAARFFLNKNYLSQLFKAETGTNFIRYLNAIRIEKAKELVLHTQETIHEISHKTGFGDFRYFSRVFRNHTGLSPTDYKAKMTSKS
ncbi:response regulator [Paenibacillus mendelii]|uniref:Response regulator n=1 Tax=Paenibacillus mendelii TaxID=206163 RepID=A0ABV6JF83_9BACL|nr:response regulator [Paenibacillus mendelii]MCQ6557402.1 response regulator [Paenibacillus mendelii]